MKRSAIIPGAVYRLDSGGHWGSSRPRYVFGVALAYQEPSPQTWPYRTKALGAMFGPVEVPAGCETIPAAHAVASARVHSLASMPGRWAEVYDTLQAAADEVAGDRADRKRALALILAAAMADGRNPGRPIHLEPSPLGMLLDQLMAKPVTTRTLQWLAGRVGIDGSATVAQQIEAEAWIEERWPA